MGIRDGFEAEAAKIESARIARETQDRERVEAAQRLQKSKKDMLQALIDALSPDLGYLEEKGLRFSSEPSKFVIRGPRGTVTVAVEMLHGGSLEYYIQAVSQTRGSESPQRSESVEGALSKIGRMSAWIQN